MFVKPTDAVLVHPSYHSPTKLWTKISEVHGGGGPDWKIQQDIIISEGFPL